MSFRKKLFKNIVVLGGFTYTSQGIAFLATVVLSRLLVPEEYGFVALITVFTGFITMFSDAGLSHVIVRSDYDRLFHQSLHYLSVVIGFLLFIVVALLAFPISWFYKDPDLILPTLIMSLNFIIRSFTIAPKGILSKRLEFKVLGAYDLIGQFSEVCLMILLAFIGFSYWALIIPSVFGGILRAFIYLGRTKLGVSPMKRKYLVVGFRKSRSILGNLTGFNIINYWARNSDNLIIGKVYGADSLGIYSRAYRFLSLVLGVMTGLFGKVLYPSLKDLQLKGGDVNREYLNTLGIISLINFPVAVMFLFFSEPVVRILWSDTWIKVAELLPYIGILILTQTLNSTTGNIFILYKKESVLMRIAIPVSITAVAAIAAGAFFSYVHILRFYALSHILINLPIVMYYGFRKSFGFSVRDILVFWVPKVILSVLLVFSAWFDMVPVTILLCALYLLHLLVSQKDDLVKGFKLIARKMKMIRK